MTKSITLKSKNLSLLPDEVKRPQYHRNRLIAGIVHIGVGGFHRAHQAYYTDELIGSHKAYNWAICGIGLLENDRKMYEILKSQDHLFTVMVRHPDGKLDARVIGSVIDYLFAPEDPDAVIEKIAHHDIKIVSLTITEGGYNFNQATGEFDFENPDIQWDLMHPRQPRTVYGYLSEALRRRKERGIRPLTIQSCDNIQKNGDMAKNMLLTFTGKLDHNLSEWIETHVSFPNSMVDRITPVTAETDKQSLENTYHIKDNWPVVCEPFSQWVIEDHFVNGRPAWEDVGAKFISDVSPYEKMKIRLLNAGHTVLGFLGILYGYTYVHEAVHDSLFAEFLRNFMDKEVTPILDKVPGIDLEAYKDSLIERFGNPYIADQLVRICLESSSKIPEFLLPTIREQLQRGGPIRCSALVVAAWCRYAEGIDEHGKKYPVEDKEEEILREKAQISRHDPLAFLKIESLFGDLIHSKKFTETYTDSLQDLYQSGVKKSIRKRIDKSKNRK